MKKLVYLAMVAFAASMVACGGNNKAENAEAPVEEAPVVEEVAAEVEELVDTVTNDTVVAVAAEEVANN